MAANDLLTFCEVRRIMLAKVGFMGFRSGEEISAALAPNSSKFSSLTRLLLRSRDADKGLLGPEDTLLLRLLFEAPRRKMWTVSVADDTLSKVEVELKDMLNILAGMDPRRN